MWRYKIREWANKLTHKDIDVDQHIPYDPLGEPMAQRDIDIYLLQGETDTYVYTGDRTENTKALLRDLGFIHQFTVFTYGWSVTKGHMYSLQKYLNMENPDRMLRLVRISNGTDDKMKEKYLKICEDGVIRKRWWQHYIG